METPSEPASPVAITGLTSRGGLSNWVFFAYPERLVMMDLGVGAALKAGALAGVGEHGHYGPAPSPRQSVEAWQQQLRAKARQVVELADDQVRSVRVHLRMLAHQLVVVAADGNPRKLTFMNRDQAQVAIEALGPRLGDRLAVTTSPIFAFLRRRAPFLLK